MTKTEIVDANARWTAIKKELTSDELKHVMSGELKPHLSIKLKTDFPPDTCGGGDKDGVKRYCYLRAKDCYETK